MSPNQVLSKPLQVTPLKGEEVATFVLLNAAKKEAGREEPITPEYYVLAGKQNVNDPFDEHGNTKKTIMNVVATVQAVDKGKPAYDAQGAPIMIEKTEKVEFVRGFKTVTANDNNTFQFMMRRKDNVSNPFRNQMGGKTVKPVFKLVEDKKELADLLQFKEVQFLAVQMVRGMNMTNLKALAMKINESPDVNVHVKALVSAPNDPSAIKHEMILRAESHPKLVINSSDDQKSRLKVQIYEGITLGVLRYDQNKFYLLTKDFEEIHTVDPDKDHVESLMEYFMKEEKGRAKYQDFGKALKAVLKA